jgi:hypothetical protein
LKCRAATGIIALLSVASLAAGAPNELSKQRFVPVELINRAGWLPAPSESAATGLSDHEEWPFATCSFSDIGTVYNLEFYYRRLYSRLRVRVLAGDRELHGLLNRFYGFEASGRNLLCITTTDDGSAAISLNSGRLVIRESAIDTDAIYDALETFLNKNEVSRNYAKVYMHAPPGLLERTCQARIMPLGARDYLLSEDGQVEQLTLESLLAAYNSEGVKAMSPGDYDEIAWSMIVTEHKATSRWKIILISSAYDIPGYSQGELDSAREAEISVPQVRSDPNARTDYWTCYTYRPFHGVVARYTFGFREGQLQSAERLVLSEGIGNASYLAGELPHTSRASGPVSGVGSAARPRRQPFATLAAVSTGVAAILLLCALFTRRHIRTSLERQRHESR